MWFGKITGDTVTVAAKREGFEAKEPVKGRQGVDDQEDTFLLQSIARHRDREAYARLFERYQGILLGLAYFMLRDREAAEEVVQEAMLTVWTSASKFAGECSAGAWIKSIVFRKCLQTQRNQGRREQVLRRLPTPGPAQELPPEQSECAEAKRVLRSLLSGLSREDRVLVALYAAGEMSQDQIAAALFRPQTTISYRLQKSMERLKAGLRAAGFSSALSLVSQAGLHESILEEVTVPPDFSRRMLEQPAAESPRVPAGLSRAGLAHPWLVLAAACSVLAAMALGAGVVGRAPPPSVPQGAATERETVNRSAPAGQPALLHKKWDFNRSGSTDGLTISTGRWEHVPQGSVDGSGCMETRTPFFLVKMDVRLDQAPLLLVLRMRALTAALPVPGALVYAIWNPHHRRAIFNGLFVPLEAGSWYTYQLFIHQDYVDVWSVGQRRTLAYFEARRDAALCLVLRGTFLLDDLEIRQIAESELPDLNPYQQALEQIPEAARRGIVPLPQFKQARPPQAACINFVTPKAP